MVKKLPEVTMLFVWLSVVAALAAATWVWRNRPQVVLARLEDRYNLIVPRHRRGDVAERLAMLGLRLSTRLIEVACDARALAGRVLNKPAGLQNKFDELGRSTAGLTAADKIMELVLANLHDNAEKAKKGEECMKLEARVYELLKDFHRHQRLREKLTGSDKPARVPA